MNINQTLFNEVKRSYMYIGYDLDLNDFDRFLADNCEFQERQRLAIKIIEDIITTHGKKNLLRCVTELARVEYNIRELQPWVRDHVVHALLSFILGININEKFLNSSVDYFQWKLAGLLHDVGYPVQIAKDILKPFTAK